MGAAAARPVNDTIHDPHLQQASAIGVCSRADQCRRSQSMSSLLPLDGLDRGCTPNGGGTTSSDNAEESDLSDTEETAHDGMELLGGLAPEQHVFGSGKGKYRIFQAT